MIIASAIMIMQYFLLYVHFSRMDILNSKGEGEAQNTNTRIIRNGVGKFHD